ncbi:hypothetical protein [Streptomyces sp. CB03911]|uniref:hypothetical protein n=1 Tax=Streptomyces sp. CB03911 TaxID=1804758 RepID=UPI0018FE7473|nr:hypothetical protein [Streptomyces sp. CB03911]
MGELELRQLHVLLALRLLLCRCCVPAVRVPLRVDAGRHHPAVRRDPERVLDVPAAVDRVLVVQVDAVEPAEVGVQVGLVVEDPAELRVPLPGRGRPPAEELDDLGE